MNKYKFSFLGLKIGSIGNRRKYSLVIKAENIINAELKIYETHEHVQILSVNGNLISKDYDIKKLEIIPLFKVYKVFRKSQRRQLIEKNLTREQAQRLVQSFPDSNTSMVVFNRQ